MDLNKLTHKSQEALGAAQKLAAERSHAEIAPEHLLMALLGQAEGAVYPTLQKLGASPRVLRDKVADLLDRIPKSYVEGGDRQPYASAALASALDRAQAEADALRDAYVSTEHILLA